MNTRDPLSRPRTPGQLRAYLREWLDIDVAPRALIRGSSSPLEYLCHAFFEPVECGAEPRDCVVWANRGGGKTFYAAVASLLDLVFKPGVEIKVLAGSLEQAQRMHAHLRGLLAREPFCDMIEGRVTDRRAQLTNGSRLDLLAQSQTSVRGSRPQILRCDEVDLFDPDIWEAAQLVTRSKQCGAIFVPGRVEALSTWHRPGGLMSRIIDAADFKGGGEGVPPLRRLFRWSVVDVLATCEPERPCSTCELNTECAGRAKAGAGHIAIDDAISLKRRVGVETWETEMLCLRPKRTDSVFPEFDASVHVREFDPPPAHAPVKWVAGMDFGYRAPTVVLFGCIDDDDVLRIVGEHVASEMRLAHHIDAILGSPWPRPEWIGCDPAGRQVNDQTGECAFALMRARGLSPRAGGGAVHAGVQRVRARLRPASGGARLFVHPRCATLIDSLTRAHYPFDDPASLSPVKDGSDHACDALRYLVTCLDEPQTARATDYANPHAA